MPPIRKIDISAIFCLLASFICEIMNAGRPRIRISVKALITPVIDIPSRENPRLPILPVACSESRVKHVVIQRRVSTRVNHQPYRNHLVSMVKHRRYMKMIDILMKVMEVT